MRTVGRRVQGMMLLVLWLTTGCAGAFGPTARSAAPPALSAPAAAQPAAPAGPTGAAGLSPAAFLQAYDLQAQGEPERFPVQVPPDWTVPLGAYPTGLFWSLANVYSLDAGLDLRLLKGQTVTVWRYRLAGGLPGEGDSSKFSYPSNIVLLVRDEQVLGAWLAFNLYQVGPSVKRRNFEAITGITFDEWVYREGFFADAGPNADLAKLGPAEVLDAFFDAINRGDKRRANACLTPRQQWTALTVNLGPNRLYNPEFGDNNTMTENILHGKLLSFRMVDPDHPGTELRELGDRTRVELAAEVEIKWRMAEFNTPSGRTIRFAGMEKGPYGWKLEGLGTGP